MWLPLVTLIFPLDSVALIPSTPEISDVLLLSFHEIRHSGRE